MPFFKKSNQKIKSHKGSPAGNCGRKLIGKIKYLHLILATINIKSPLFKTLTQKAKNVLISGIKRLMIFFDFNSVFLKLEGVSPSSMFLYFTFAPLIFIGRSLSSDCFIDIRISSKSLKYIFLTVKPMLKRISLIPRGEK